MPWMRGRVHAPAAIPKVAASTPEDPVLAKTVDQIAKLMTGVWGGKRAPRNRRHDPFVPLRRGLQEKGHPGGPRQTHHDYARMIKTQDEIELMRITCANSEKAFAAIVDAIRPG